jgi:serine/threonine protein kinase
MDYIGKNIGNYNILKLIGEGGMASVYEAKHIKLGTKAAVKILNPILSANSQLRERFENEARLMATFNHPNITRVIDYVDSETTLAIVIEYLEGNDLSDTIKKNGKFSDEECREIFIQILSAFSYAHSAGIVHRDIKPSNIFLLPDGTVKILDFGIAKLFGQGNEMTQTGTQMGTPIYMSPEQVKADKSIDHRSDIYSLGVTMYFCLTGNAPYDANTASHFDIFNKIVHEPLPELPANNPFKEMVSKACSKDRELRFQSCDEWLNILKSGVVSHTDNSERTIVGPIVTNQQTLETKVQSSSVSPNQIESDNKRNESSNSTQEGNTSIQNSTNLTYLNIMAIFAGGIGLFLLLRILLMFYYTISYHL